MIKYLIILISILILNACQSYNDVAHKPSVDGNISDNPSWFDGSDEEVLEMRVNIPNPNDYLCAPYDDIKAPPRPCTLLDIENDTNPYDEYEPVLHVQMQTDDFLSQTTANASIKQKGKSTRKAKQKSFRLKLDSKTNLYKGERTFQLNKHPYDISRIRNKLSFDLFKNIPNIMTLKTQFINLKINGKDYGLFTHVEYVGEEFLRNRGLNEEDNLYKAQNFAFFLYDELKPDANGNIANQEAFDAIVEMKAGKDVKKLWEMLVAVNDFSNDFDTIFNKYFDRDNYLTWFAINIILSNKDTVSQNFYLYNPKYSDKFYFIPWDYDGAGRLDDRYTKVELGLGNWWGIPLHKRFLSIKKNREDLDSMVNLLREKYITPDTIQKYIDKYKKLIQPILSISPDIDHLSQEKWLAGVEDLIPQLERNLENYRSQFGHPMPFWQWHTYENGKLSLFWEKSVDFEGDEIVYDLNLSNTPDFNETMIIQETNLEYDPNLNVLEYTKKIKLEPGKYYMKVVAKERYNPSHYQIGFEKSVKIGKVKYPGVYMFEVK